MLRSRELRRTRTYRRYFTTSRREESRLHDFMLIHTCFILKLSNFGDGYADMQILQPSTTLVWRFLDGLGYEILTRIRISSVAISQLKNTVFSFCIQRFQQFIYFLFNLQVAGLQNYVTTWLSISLSIIKKIHFTKLNTYPC